MASTENTQMQVDADVKGQNFLYVLQNMAIAWTESVALRTIVELQVPLILATQAAPPRHAMSANQLLQHMPGASNPDAGALEPLLRLLTCKGLFAEHLEESPHMPAISDSADVLRTFALTPMSRLLVPGHPRDSMTNFVLTISLGARHAASLEHLSKAILTSADPFTLAHGKNQYDWMASHPEELTLFQQAMSEMTEGEQGPLLMARYSGFNTVHSIMDVGGSAGVLLALIIRNYPHIKRAINFDLPEVVAVAPASPGIEHVGGNMFESIPTGCDAIFMKKVLHNWDDDTCIKILKNCYKALPETGGKLILVEGILPQETPKNTTVEQEFVFKASVHMFVHCAHGKERTEHDFSHLVTVAGFHNFQVVVNLDATYVMEAFK